MTEFSVKYTKVRSEILSSRMLQLRRTDRIEQNVRAYDPTFRFHEVDAAYKQARQWAKAGSKDNLLRIAELLVKFSKADRETILASILIVPFRGREADPDKLNVIEEKFGAKVRILVETQGIP